MKTYKLSVKTKSKDYSIMIGKNLINNFYKILKMFWFATCDIVYFKRYFIFWWFIQNSSNKLNYIIYICKISDVITFII